MPPWSSLLLLCSFGIGLAARSGSLGLGRLLIGVQVAPLRDRKEDIPPLAKHFIDLSVRELRSPKPRLTRAGIAKLQSYDWPGNVRELRNVIDRAVILARGSALDFDLPGGDGRTRPTSTNPQAEPDGENPGFLTESQIRDRERDNLLAVLEKSGWKIKGETGAAELLGIKPTTLISRVKKQD